MIINILLYILTELGIRDKQSREHYNFSVSKIPESIHHSRANCLNTYNLVKQYVISFLIKRYFYIHTLLDHKNNNGVYKAQ